MSKKNLLLNFLALSCLANSGVWANEKNNVKKSLPPPPQEVVKSVSDKNKNENKIEKTDSFLLRNKSNLMIGGAGVLTGAIASGLITGYSVDHVNSLSFNKQLQAKDNKITDLNNQITTLKGQVNHGDAGHEEQIKQLTTEKEKLEAEKTALNTQLVQANNNLSTANDTIKQKESQIEDLQKQNAALTTGGGEALKNLNEQLNVANEKFNNSKTENLKLQNEINSKTSEMKTLNEEKNKLEEQVKKLGDEKTEFVKQLETLQNEKKELLKGANIAKDLQEKLNGYDKLKEETNKLKNEIKEQNNTIRDIFGESYDTISGDTWRYKKILKLGRILQETIDEKPKKLKVGEKEYEREQNWKGWISAFSPEAGSNWTKKEKSFDVNGENVTITDAMIQDGLITNFACKDEKDGLDCLGKELDLMMRNQNLTVVTRVNRSMVIKFINFAINLTKNMNESGVMS